MSLRIPLDLRQALLIVWTILSFAGLGIIILPRVADLDAVSRRLPPCESQAKYGRPCAFCGMTRAFYDVTAGDWQAASTANRGAIPLYLLLAGNTAYCAIFVALRVRRGGVLPCKS